MSSRSKAREPRTGRTTQTRRRSPWQAPGRSCSRARIPRRSRRWTRAGIRDAGSGIRLAPSEIDGDSLEGDMKRSFTVVVSAAIVAAFSASLSAQWALHLKPGVPKGADGKPNLKAPGTAPAGQPPLATFGDIGSGFKEGLPYRPLALDLVKKRMGALDNPDAL